MGAWDAYNSGKGWSSQMVDWVRKVCQASSKYIVKGGLQPVITLNHVYKSLFTWGTEYQVLKDMWQTNP